MRALVVADIHSNLTALQAVAGDAVRRGGFDAVWCLGDVVGYGPDPNECVAWLRERDARCVAGNHDLACAGAMPVDGFNPWAAAACQWTQARLTPGSRTWLLALTPLPLVEGDFTLIHGSLRDPVWEYAVTPEVAAASLKRQTTPWCLVGHSHLPLAFRQGAAGPLAGVFLADGEVVRAGSDRVLCNPGSVGQPRDGDPRAAYALVDTEAGTLAHHRVAYDVLAVQARMREAGLPEPLAVRLAFGR